MSPKEKFYLKLCQEARKILKRDNPCEFTSTGCKMYKFETTPACCCRGDYYRENGESHCPHWKPKTGCSVDSVACLTHICSGAPRDLWRIGDLAHKYNMYLPRGSMKESLQGHYKARR